jgi:hypothetical protein
MAVVAKRRTRQLSQEAQVTAAGIEQVGGDATVEVKATRPRGGSTLAGGVKAAG